MHRSYGLQGSLKRRYKHPSPTSINGYHTAKKLLSQSPAKRPTFAFADKSGYTLGPAQRIAHKGTHGETGAFRTGTLSLPSERSARSRTSPGRVSERRTLPLLGLGRGCSQRTQRASGQRCAYACRCPEASRPRWAALLCLQFGDVAVFSLCAQYFLNVRDTGGITTLGVLCMLPKCRTAACQSGSFAVSLYPPFTFAKAPAGHCQYALALRTFCLQAESFS